MKTVVANHSHVMRFPIALGMTHTPPAQWDNLPNNHVNRVEVPAGTMFTFDETAANGAVLLAYCSDHGMTE